jgi:hypothetical protein
LSDAHEGSAGVREQCSEGSGREAIASTGGREECATVSATW